MKGVKPRYRDLREWEIPEVVTDDGKVTIKVISGRSHGVESVKELAYTLSITITTRSKPVVNLNKNYNQDSTISCMC